MLQADALSKHYGVEASPLSDPELLTLTNAIPQMTPEEKVVLAETLAVAPELWGDIAKKVAVHLRWLVLLVILMS